MFAAEGNQQAKETVQPRIFTEQIPIHPADLVVLAIRVIVAGLGASELIAGQDHGNAVGEQKNGGEVTDLALAQAEDLGVVRLALGAAVPTQVVVMSIGVT